MRIWSPISLCAQTSRHRGEEGGKIYMGLKWRHSIHCNCVSTQRICPRPDSALPMEVDLVAKASTSEPGSIQIKRGNSINKVSSVHSGKPTIYKVFKVCSHNKGTKLLHILSAGIMESTIKGKCLWNLGVCFNCGQIGHLKGVSCYVSRCGESRCSCYRYITLHFYYCVTLIMVGWILWVICTWSTSFGQAFE